MALAVKKIDTKSFGDRCRQLRMKHDLRQDTIAKHIGCVRAYVSGVELGKLHPSINFIVGIKEFYKTEHSDNKPYDWWIEGIDFSVDQVNIKSHVEKIEVLESMLKDKERLIKLLEK